MDARLVEDREAEAAFVAAKSGNAEAVKTVYFAVFAATLVLCRELGVPIHIHSGHTGGGIDAHISKTNPILLEPLLREDRFRKTTVVFLHGAYPHAQTAALMAHHLPHVWVDLSWTLPWTSLRFDRSIEDVLAIAPHSKILLGSGQHGIPEISWLASLVAKDSLASTLSDAVARGIIGRVQAETSARMICFENARRLYHLD
jgi:predicted TIM-barrel fold metal-dependent hydrolase